MDASNLEMVQANEEKSIIATNIQSIVNPIMKNALQAVSF